MIGSSGTGKTVLVKDFLENNDLDDLLFANMNFNSFIDAPAVQFNLELRIEKKTKNIYGLGGGQILVFYIDDLNMPAKD
jgi:dynein heavy chain